MYLYEWLCRSEYGCNRFRSGNFYIHVFILEIGIEYQHIVYNLTNYMPF